MAMPTRGQLVIFDCDGVLVDSESTSNRVLAEAISEAGLPIQPDAVGREFEGMRLADIKVRVEQRLGRPLGETWIHDFEAARVKAFESGVDPIPGVGDVLRGLGAAGHSVCVASQARREKMELTLGLAGLRGYFDDAAWSLRTPCPVCKPHGPPGCRSSATSRVKPTVISPRQARASSTRWPCCSSYW